MDRVTVELENVRQALTCQRIGRLAAIWLTRHRPSPVDHPLLSLLHVVERLGDYTPRSGRFGQAPSADRAEAACPATPTTLTPAGYCSTLPPARHIVTGPSALS